MRHSAFKYILLAAFAWTGLPTIASADATGTVWGEVEPGKTYEYKGMTPVEGFYVAKQTSQIRCYSTGDIVNAYYDAAHTNPIEPTQHYYTPEGTKVRYYPTTQGDTVFLYNNFPLSDGTFRLEDGKEQISYPTLTPSPTSGELSMSTDYRLSLAFNIPVKISKCKMQAGDTSVEMPLNVSGQTATVNWHNTLMDWYASGIVGAGSELTLTFTGIRDEYDSSNRPDYGDGLGKLIIRYKMAAEPARLVEEHNTPASGTPDFLSYYLPGGEEGLVRLFFNRDLQADCKPEATIQYGDPDNLELGLYIEHPPVRISGGMVEIDLRGKTRFPDDMVPGLPQQPYIGLRITGLRSSEGQLVLTGSTASPYTFGFNYRYKTVAYSIGADWYPLPGSELKAGDKMEIWVLNGNKIQFDTVDFTFTKSGSEATASVPYSSLKALPDPTYDDAMIYTLSAPALDADEGSDVTVTFGGLKCADGLDHSGDIRVRYKAGTSGVDTLDTESREGLQFDLQGRRASASSRGIIIRDGRKALR